MKTVHLLARTASTVGGLKTPIGAFRNQLPFYRSLEFKKRLKNEKCENEKVEQKSGA